MKNKKPKAPVTQTAATDTDVEALKNLAESLVADGDLSEDDLKKLTNAIDAQEERARLTAKQAEDIMKVVNEGVRENDPSEVSPWLKRFGVLSFVLGAFTIAMLVLAAVTDITAGSKMLDSYQGSTLELVLYIIQFVLFVIGTVLHIILGVRLVKGKRYAAAQIATALVIIGVFDIFTESLLTGFGLSLLFSVVLTALRIALSSYLSPSLSRERKLIGNMRMSDTKSRFEHGTLGLDLDGKGYIKLDFFNLFWIFIVASILGLIVEGIFHMVVVEPGVWQNRPGLLFGPFSPIYGVGACLMTIAVNRFHNIGLIPVFLVCTLVGGTFEWFVSWWMETAFGVIAWDYSNEFLNVGGRTCLWFASMFGMCGLWWSQWALPRLLTLINCIPWKIRYSVTALCAVLMLFNIGMTLQSLDCWQERVNGKPVVSDIQKFYAENFDNDTMQSIFENMVITPQNK